MNRGDLRAQLTEIRRKAGGLEGHGRRDRPWILALSGAEAGLARWLEAHGSFERLADEGPGGLGAWVARGALLLVLPAAVLGSEDELDRQRWFQLLRALRGSGVPLGGAVVALGPDELSEGSSRWPTALRARLEEITREIGLDLPLSVMVTQLDRVDGFEAFVSRLPRPMQSAPFGWALERADGDRDAIRDLDRGLGAIVERLVGLRVAILDRGVPAGDRRGVFGFPFALGALLVNLRPAIRTLAGPDPRFHTPRLASVLLTGDRSDAGLVRFGEGIDRLLAREAALARGTVRGTVRRRTGTTARVAGLAALVLLPVLFLASAWHTDRFLARSLPGGACALGEGEDVDEVLEDLDRCVATLDAYAARIDAIPVWRTMGFDERVARRADVAGRFVDGVEKRLLPILDRGLDRAFGTGPDPVPLMLLVAGRTELIRQCDEPERCRSVLASPPSIDYERWLRAGGGRPGSEGLRDVYERFLEERAALGAPVTDELASASSRLAGWAASPRFHVETVLRSFDQLAPPVGLERFWDRPAAAGRAPRLGSACGPDVWTDRLEPLIERIHDAAPESLDALRRLAEEQRRRCHQEWESFLGEFQLGAEGWTGSEGELTELLLSDDSPHDRVVRWALAWARSSVPDEERATWLRSLADFEESAERRAFDQALGDLARSLGAEHLPRRCFQLARDTLEEARPHADASSPLLRAWALTESLGRQPGGEVGARLQQGRLQLVWRRILDRASRHLDERWRAEVMDPAGGLSDAQIVARLHGPGGALTTYVDRHLREFLDERGRPRALMGESLALGSRFRSLLERETRVGGVVGGVGSGPELVIRAERPSRLEPSWSSFEIRRTVLSIVCQGTEHRVTSGQGSRPAPIRLPWTPRRCPEATLEVHVWNRDDPDAADVTLVRRIRGESALLELVDEFRDGLGILRLADLRGSPPPRMVEDVRSIRVYVRIEAPRDVLGLATSGSAPPRSILDPDR